MSQVPDDRLTWFRDARFGIFLHWGLFSVLGRNEWSLYLDRWTVAEYAKLAERFVADLVQVAAEAGNLLLNTGPQADGRIRPEEEQRIRTAGKWLLRNGEAVYGSRRSPLDAHGAMGSANRQAHWIGTDDPCVHYLAALCWTGTEFMTVLVDGEVESASLLSTGVAVAFRRGKQGRLTFVDLPETPPDPLCTVFRVQFAEPPRHMPLLRDGSWLESEL